ncbi:MAG: hypothetical protein PHO32_03875 [Candidatus Cloacimonetes bacterium]|nr:hypothetical protein [Candidatus Cloacimonadota bacterium]
MAYYNNIGKNKNNPDINVNPSDFESYTRNFNSFNIGMGYNVKQLPYAPTQVDISYRSGADKMKTSSVIQTDNENSGLTVSLFSKFIDIPLSTQLSLAFNGQKQQVIDAKNRNQSMLLGANYFWDKLIKPYANYRWLNLSGYQGKQYYGYLTFGAEAYPIKNMTVSEAYPIKNMTVSTDFGFQIHGVKSDSHSEYGAFTWRLLLSQAF